MAAAAAALQEAVASVAAGDRRALARVLSHLEDRGTAGLAEALAGAGCGRTPVLGLTGPPGAGKSTLGDRLVGAAVVAGLRVAVLAVDPSSPVTGGALLGDRVRMAVRDPERVFYRSLANRGAVGGLAGVVPAAIAVLGAGGFDLVIVETVGAGQSELDIAAHADLTVVVLSPQTGDATQAGKAGLMEIGDLIVLNKADLPGAARALGEIRAMVRLRSEPSTRVPVLKVSAAEGAGVDELWKLAWGRLQEPRPSRRERAAWFDGVPRAVASAVELAARGTLSEDHPFRRAARGEIDTDEAVAWALHRLDLT